jgi:CBS domain-containing protein
MKAGQIMTSPVLTVTRDVPAREAIALLAARGITSLPVVDEDGDVIGIVSEVDLLRRRVPHDPRAHLMPQHDSGDPPRTVGEVMSDAVVCLSENADAADLAEVLVDNRIRAVPILRGGDLVGIVSRRDVLRTLVRDDEAIRAEVRERLAAYAGEPDRWRVSVADGVVTVSGMWMDERDRAAVTNLATTVPGVVRVHVHRG